MSNQSGRLRLAPGSFARHTVIKIQIAELQERESHALGRQRDDDGSVARRQRFLNPFLGVLYLGLPYLLYTFLYRQQRYTPVSAGHLLLLFALGMLSAIPSLLWQRISIAPFFWLVVVLATVWRWERWDERWDGLVYTIALALGFTSFYTHPVLIPIPAFTGFLGSLLQIQERYMQRTVWPWEAKWWWISLGAIGAAAILGYLSSQARLSKGRARIPFLILGLFSSVAFLAVDEIALFVLR